MITICILLQLDETFSGKKSVDDEENVNALIFRTREEFSKYAEVNSAMKIELEVIGFAKANTEQIRQHDISS